MNSYSYVKATKGVTIIMKKTYNAPSISVYNIGKTNIMAASDLRLGDDYNGSLGADLFISDFLGYPQMYVVYSCNCQNNCYKFKEIL